MRLHDDTLKFSDIVLRFILKEQSSDNYNQYALPSHYYNPYHYGWSPFGKQYSWG